jgi:hypothetical protein
MFSREAEKARDTYYGEVKQGGGGERAYTPVSSTGK